MTDAQGSAPSPAVAPPPGNPRFALMDAARGVGATFVVLAHTTIVPSPMVKDLVEQADAWVQMFFGLSGFLLFRPFVASAAGIAPAPRIWEFLQRRALRVLPGYWFALLAIALVLGSQTVPGVLSGDWWRYFGFLQVYSLRTTPAGLSVAWSLCVEVSFYIALPGITGFARRLSRRWGWRRGCLTVVAVLFALGPVVRLLDTLPLDLGVLHAVQRMTYTLPGQMGYFAVGMALAVASVDHALTGRIRGGLRFLAERPTACWAGAAGLYVFAALVFGFAHPYSGLDFRTRFLADTFATLAFVCLIMVPLVFDLRDNPVRRAMRLRAVVYTGVVSYSLYLWHVPLVAWLAQRDPLRYALFHFSFVPRTLVTFAAAMAAALLVATLSYRFVELPFLVRKPGYARRGRSRPRPAAVP